MVGTAAPAIHQAEAKRSETLAPQQLEDDRTQADELFVLPENELRAPEWLTPILDNFAAMPAEPHATYVSPIQRRPALRARPAPAPSPLRFVKRQNVSASACTIAASSQQNTAGTEKFKPGQFADTNAWDAAELSAQPMVHLLHAPRLTTRALPWLKTGCSGPRLTPCVSARSRTPRRVQASTSPTAPSRPAAAALGPLEGFSRLFPLIKISYESI